MFKLSYIYMKMMSLQTVNVIEKIINDSIKSFMFDVLKLLCSNFFLHLSYFPTSTSVLNCVASQI